jgi:hypothetical protein
VVRDNQDPITCMPIMFKPVYLDLIYKRAISVRTNVVTQLTIIIEGLGRHVQHSVPENWSTSPLRVRRRRHALIKPPPGGIQCRGSARIGVKLWFRWLR